MVTKKVSDGIFVCVSLLIIVVCTLVQYFVSSLKFDPNLNRFLLSCIVISVIVIILEFFKILIYSLFASYRKPKNSINNIQKIKKPFDSKANDVEYTKILRSSYLYDALLEDKYKNRGLNVRYNVKFKDMIVYVVYFLVLILFITHLDGEYDATYIARQCLLERHISRYGLSQMHSITELYDYLQHTIIEAIYKDDTKTGTGTSWPNLEMTKLISEVYLVQSRYQHIKYGDKPVYITDDFGTGWDASKTDAGTADDTPWRKYNPWKYTIKARNDWLIPTHLRGNLYKLPTNKGYMTLFAKTKQESLKILEYIKTNNWLDLKTAAVNILFTIYNVDLNVFISVNLLVEQTPFGNVICKDNIETVELLPAAGDLEYIYLFGIAVYAICIIVILKMIVERAINMPTFFDSFWNFLDVIGIIVNVLSIIFMFLFYSNGQKIRREIHKSDADDSIEFQLICDLFYINRVLYCVLLFIAVLRLTKILMVWEHFELCALTLSKSMPAIISYLVILPTFLMGFSLANNLLEGDSAGCFVHLFSSMAACMLQAFGFNIFADDEVALMSNFVDLIMLGMLLFTLKLILANMLGSIICERLEEANIVKDNYRTRPHLIFTDFLKMELCLNYEMQRNKYKKMKKERKRKEKLLKEAEEPGTEAEFEFAHKLKLKRLDKMANLFQMQIALLTSNFEEALEEIYSIQRAQIPKNKPKNDH